MPQVSRAAFLAKLNSIINDNTFGDIEPSEVRDVLTDLEDSASWFDEAVNRALTANITAGYTVTSFDIGTVSSGTTTLGFANGNVQRLVNNGAFSLAPPSSGEGTITLAITNGASAGAINTTGFTSVRGDTFNLVNGNRYICSVAVVSGVSWLTIVGASGNT